MALKRWRVRSMQHDYMDPGPDLLQPKPLAANDLGKTMGKVSDGWFVRIIAPDGKTSGWSKHPLRKVETLERYSRWQHKSGDKARFQVGRKHKGDIEPRYESMSVHVRHVAMANVNPGANLVADLTREHFQGLNVGGFSCREYNGVPGSGWSDHAWGDAVDLSGPNNDHLFDWCVRMGRAGCMEHCAQFIGSRDGKVGSAYAPAYAWNPGGPESHLSHVHASYRQHFGTNPGCN